MSSHSSRTSSALAKANTQLPTSFAQERVWMLQKMEPDSRAYHFQATLTFDGAFDAAALERSLRDLVERHAIFRTTFPAIDGHPIQAIAAQWKAPLVFVDYTGEPDAEASLAAKLQDELATHFDLERLPLVRWTLVRVRPDRHVLMHVEHHLLHDGWSFNVFLNELATLYRAHATGSAAILPPVPLQFGECAERQRAAARSGAFDRQIAYWKQKLAGAPPALRLTTDRPRPPRQTYAGATVSVELPASLCKTLESHGREAQCTPFMTMYAAFATLLHRYTSDADICVGTGVAARWPEAERAIGMLVNNITLRTDLSGDPTFRELLGRVRGMMLEAYANQDVPFDRVVEAVRPIRDPAVHPLYSVMFSFHDSPPPDLTVTGTTVTLVQALDNGTAKFDLNFIGIPHPGGMTLRWEFNRDLFERETIARMAEHFRRLLDAIAAEPERRISRLPMMGDAERRKVLAWRGQRMPYERDATIHELFRQQAARTPSAIAVQGDDCALTYAELDARSNRLANHLRAAGVKRESAVGVAMERSAELPIALFGILKAGGAYVPLDAEYPAERLAFMLRDAGVTHVVCDSSSQDRLPVGRYARIDVEQHADAIAACSGLAPAVASDGDALAYVIYTSGSTGTPKGVGVVHRGVVRLVRGADYLAMGPDDVFLQFAPLSFDASTFEIFAPLLNGGRLAIAPPGPISLAELGRAVERHGVTTLWLTASLFHRMAESETAHFRGVRTVLTGGDVVSPEHARRFLEAVPTCALIDAYGPTENTTFSTCHRIPSAESIGARLPIGRPIANSTTYIVDRHLEPVPIGVPGELCVGGDGLARGYLSAPELTAERFITDPFGEVEGARLYRTGDRARFRADGEIEFLGRLDQQVKIRGFRIEPGEIESALRGHTDVVDVAVSMADVNGDRLLVGYVVPAPGSAVDEATVRGFLSSKLPKYMVPERLFVVPQLPANPSGKLDRGAVAAMIPSTIRPVASTRPRSPTESSVGALVAEMLGRDRVEPTDDLFDLGVHSLMAMRLVARLEPMFGVEIPLRAFFDDPTVAGLAAAIDKASRSAAREGSDKRAVAVP